ncbi:MAG TPA: DUF1844 domain-containing protein [Phycisphaerae bacterium]|mgnify:CR=1 FL=1|nr:DUF1844 domain-containing protein [Phycisphaerales bacterium]HRX85039.1 DUF1844 domain-containing protein [Phycisphaerae bacterium]
MSTGDGPKIHIDSDWKAEAEREKERLAEQEAQQPQQEALGEVTFVHLINMLAMQAAVALGGMRGPNGEAIPPDPELARFHIDMLGLLEKKTAGNLEDDEKKMLTGVLHELRSSYVHLMDALVKHAAGQGPQKS